MDDNEIIHKLHGIDDCLHTNAGENGLTDREDGTIKCYDCGRVFNYPSDLTKDTAMQAIKLARADTANKIFEELEKVAWQRIEPSRLAEFYEQFCNAKDPEAALKVAIAFSIIGFDAEKYEAIRKQFRVD